MKTLFFPMLVTTIFAFVSEHFLKRFDNAIEGYREIEEECKEERAKLLQVEQENAEVKEEKLIDFDEGLVTQEEVSLRSRKTEISNEITKDNAVIHQNESNKDK